MEDLDTIVSGLSDSEWKKLCATQQNQVALKYFVEKLKDDSLKQILHATTLEEFLTIRGTVRVLFEADKQIKKNRKESEAKSKPTTLSMFRTD